MRKKLCALLILVSPLAWASDIEYRDEPMLPNRTPLDPGTLESLVGSELEITEFTRKYQTRLGLATILSYGQLEYYRGKGTYRSLLYGLIAEFGITPEEDERLVNAGLTFILDRSSKFDDFHWAALSDTIVEGTVSRLKGYPNGTYHTKVEINVARVYKECGPSLPERKREFWLLHAGPHQRGDHVIKVISGEPRFRRGEKVVILAGRNPVSLRTFVGIQLAAETLHLQEENYGPSHQLLSRASKGQPGVLEIYTAFKVVGNRLVRKGGGYREKGPTDVVNRRYFAKRVAAISAAQKSECRARVAMVEAQP